MWSLSPLNGKPKAATVLIINHKKERAGSKPAPTSVIIVLVLYFFNTFG